MSAKRVIDQPYGTYSVFVVTQSGIDVKCPQCGGQGIVISNYGRIRFSCRSCGKSITKDTGYCRYDVHNQCDGCGRYYRANITTEKEQHHAALRVPCPHCGYIMQGRVHKTQIDHQPMYPLRHGCEPYFGLELWFLDEFDGKNVWALNREHLAYLIDYLEADLREKPLAPYPVKRTQADQLPGFMKTAKNRKRMVKLLLRMQRKPRGNQV